MGTATELIEIDTVGFLAPPNVETHKDVTVPIQHWSFKVAK